MTGAGTVSPKNELDFKMRVALHNSGGVLQAIGGKGDTTVPLFVRGTAANPSFVPDVKGMATEKVQSVLKSDKVNKALEGSGEAGKAAKGLLDSLLSGKKTKIVHAPTFGFRWRFGAAVAVVCLFSRGVVWAQATGGIRGTVVDARGGEALARVQVRLAGTDYATITDGRGVFALTGVRAGGVCAERQHRGLSHGEAAVYAGRPARQRVRGDPEP